MILVDTSIWVQHFRHDSPHLRKLLEEGQALCHPFVVGELACGHIGNRQEVLSLLQLLPQAGIAGRQEVLDFIASRGLMGVGLGLVDVHLLASALLSRASLWTADRRLAAASRRLGCAYVPPGDPVSS